MADDRPLHAAFLDVDNQEGAVSLALPQFSEEQLDAEEGIARAEFVRSIMRDIDSLLTKEKLQALQGALDLKQRELDLVMAIDEIRDTASDPTTMLTSIVDLLANRLAADLCLMFLLDRETGEAELKAVSDRSQRWGQLQQVIARELAEPAVRLDHIAIWEGHDKLPAGSLANVPDDLQLAAVPIIMGTDQRLGALLLARSEVPFGPQDVQLLKTAEDQIDSAVIQCHVYRRHQQSIAEVRLKQRELDLIMAIDHIRDTAPEPTTMLTSIVDLLADRLAADLCLMFLLDRETGEAELKAVSDRGQRWGQLQQVITREVADQAIGLDGVTIWEARDKLPQGSVVGPENLQLAAVPIIIGTEQRLGALLLARSQVPFGPDDVELMETAEDHIDSAVIQGYLYDKHQLSVKEVETIYQIDRIRDQGLLLDEMLNKVIHLFFR